MGGYWRVFSELDILLGIAQQNQTLVDKIFMLVSTREELQQVLAGEDWMVEDGCMGWWTSQDSSLEKTSCIFTQT